MLLNPAAKRRAIEKTSAEQLARAWPIVLLGGVISLVLGVLLLAIDWTVSSLAIFVGAVFVFQGLMMAVSPPLDGGGRGMTLVAGLLSAGAGIAVMVWPEIGLATLGVFIGCWLVAAGVIHVVGALVQRHVPYWWLVLALGLIEIPIGIWALRRPGVTLALLITLAGIWQIVSGLWQIVIAFELRNLPDRVAPEAETELRARPA